MHIVEILLPLSDRNGARFSRSLFNQVRSEMTEKFGGVTAFTRTPAEGSFETGDRVVHDEIVIFEIMINRELDAG